METIITALVRDITSRHAPIVDAMKGRLWEGLLSSGHTYSFSLAPSGEYVLTITYSPDGHAPADLAPGDAFTLNMHRPEE